VRHYGHPSVECGVPPVECAAAEVPSVECDAAEGSGVYRDHATHLTNTRRWRSPVLGTSWRFAPLTQDDNARDRIRFRLADA